VPPAVNEAVSTTILETAATQVLGPEAVAQAPQSLGAEDFAWYLESIPGTLARLGTKTPGPGGHRDLHQATFDVDERAIGVGVRRGEGGGGARAPRGGGGGRVGASGGRGGRRGVGPAPEGAPAGMRPAPDGAPAGVRPAPDDAPRGGVYSDLGCPHGRHPM